MRSSEVTRRTFQRSFRGYHVDEVDNFLGQVGLELERLERRIRDLERSDVHHAGVGDEAPGLLRQAEEAADRIVMLARTEREQLRTSVRTFLDELSSARDTLNVLIDRVERSAVALSASPGERGAGGEGPPEQVAPTTPISLTRPRIARPTSPTVAVLQEERPEHVR